MHIAWDLWSQTTQFRVRSPMTKVVACSFVVAKSDYCVTSIPVGGKEDLMALESRFLKSTFTLFSEDVERVPLASSGNGQQPPVKKRRGKILVFYIYIEVEICTTW